MNTKIQSFQKRLVAKLLLAIMLTSFIPQVSAESEVLYVEDTIAGLGTHVYLNGLPSQSTVDLELQKPNGAVIYFDALQTEQSALDKEINGYHTQQSGTYKVVAQIGGRKSFSKEFEVFADAPSNMYSSVKANKKMVLAGGKEVAHIGITLLDEYKNPVTDHHVRLVSSREADTVVAVDEHPYTNAEGQVYFRVSSSESGSSTFTALNATTNNVIGERETVLFSDGTNKNLSTIKNSIATDTSMLRSSLLAQDTTTSIANTLKLTVPKTKVMPGEPFDIVVEVLDSAGNPAKDYRGKVLLLSDDPNAELPLKDVGYEFTGAEQPAGKKTFSKAGKFLTEGVKSIEVVDIDNTDLKASLTISVTSDGEVSSGESIVITRPEPGVLTTKDVTIEGKAKSFATLRIYDKGVEVAEATADGSGNFEVTLRSLVDGTHIFEVREISSTNETVARSKTVQITLKASGPQATDVTYDPTKTTYTGGEKVKVTFNAEKNLRKANAIVGGTTFPMSESSTVLGTYSGTVILPKDKGSYDLELQLESSLGSLGSTTVAEAFDVAAPLFDFTTLNYTVQDDGTVKVSWDQTAPTGSTYAIAYGTEKTALDIEKNIPSSAKSITIDNLTGGETYYFMFQVVQQGDVVVKDTPREMLIPLSLGFQNAQVVPRDGAFALSWILAGDSTKVGGVRVVYGISSGNYIREQQVDTTVLNVTIPQLVEKSRHYFVLEILSKDGEVLAKSEEFTGIIEDLRSSSVCTPGDVQGLRVTLMEGKKYLEWTAITGAEGYRVYQGTTENSYGTPVIVSDTNFEIPVLDTKEPSYFAVTAYCGDQESKHFSEAIRVESGPLAMGFLVVAMGFAAYATYRKKQRVI